MSDYGNTGWSNLRDISATNRSSTSKYCLQKYTDGEAYKCPCFLGTVGSLVKVCASFTTES